MEQSCSAHSGQEAERKRGQGQEITFPGHALSDLFPLTRFYFLKFLPPPNNGISYEPINVLIH